MTHDTDVTFWALRLVNRKQRVSSLPWGPSSSVFMWYGFYTPIHSHTHTHSINTSMHHYQSYDHRGSTG